MKKIKLLSISVAAYNVEKYLDRTLQLCLAEEILDRIEVIVVNDGSKDNTVSVAQKYVDKWPNTFKLIDKENGGHGSTINAGIAAATGKYFRLLDGDDWYDTNLLVQFVRELENLEEDIILSPYQMVFDGTGKVVKKDIAGFKYRKVYPIEEIISDLSLVYMMHGLTIKTEIVKKIKPISEHCFYVDQEYITYLLKYSKTLVVLPYAVYQYRCGLSEQSMNYKNMVKNRKMHEKVLLNILDFSEELSGNVKEFVKNRARGLCNTQILLYVLLGKAAKSELDAFINKMKESYPDDYKRIPGPRCAIIRMTGSAFIQPLSVLFRFKCGYEG